MNSITSCITLCPFPLLFDLNILTSIGIFSFIFFTKFDRLPILVLLPIAVLNPFCNSSTTALECSALSSVFSKLLLAASPKASISSSSSSAFSPDQSSSSSDSSFLFFFFSFFRSSLSSFSELSLVLLSSLLSSLSVSDSSLSDSSLDFSSWLNSSLIRSFFACGGVGYPSSNRRSSISIRCSCCLISSASFSFFGLTVLFASIVFSTPACEN